MRFFGTRYSSSVYEGAHGVAIPVGQSCAHCDEPIAPGDDGWVIPPEWLPFHRACFLRGVIGSVAHQQRRCGCFVRGSTCNDDPALTRRQAAEAATEFYEGRRE